MTTGALTKLILILGETPEAEILWGLVTGGRVLSLGRASGLAGLAVSGAPAAPAARADVTVALIPGEQTTWRRLPAPPRTLHKQRAAAGLLLEDELAEPVASVHYAVAPSGAVLAVADPVMAGWRDAFGAAGFTPDILSSDSAALAGGEGEVLILRDSRRTVLGAPGLGAACETPLFDAIVPQLLQDLSGLAVRLVGEESELPAVLRNPAPDWLGPASDGARLEFMAGALARRDPPNLLQGAYRRRRAMISSFAAWRRPAAIAAGLGLISLFAVVIDAWRLERTAERWRDLAAALHAERFPDAAGADPAAHARAILGASGGDASFIGLSAEFAEALDAGEGVQIDRVGFDRRQRRMTVTVRSGSHEAIEAFRVALSEDGVKVRDNGGFRRAGADLVGDLLADGL